MCESLALLSLVALTSVACGEPTFEGVGCVDRILVNYDDSLLAPPFSVDIIDVERAEVFSVECARDCEGELSTQLDGKPLPTTVEVRVFQAEAEIVREELDLQRRVFSPNGPNREPNCVIGEGNLQL